MRVFATSAAIALLFTGITAAQNLAEFEKRVTQFKLDNGLRFIVLERHQAPVASFEMFVNVGSVNDPPGKSSMAHMFEHMIGKGTRSVGTSDYAKEQAALEKIESEYDKLASARNSGDAADPKTLQQIENALKSDIEAANTFVDPNAFPRIIEEQGGVGFNAGTGQDSTNYFYSLPANKTELWFLLQSEWLKRPVFREFYKERDVVREERRMRAESDTQGKLLELLLTTSFMAHPYRNWIGWANEIESLRARDADAFFREYYVPGNIVISIVGDVDPARIKQLAQKYFGTIPAAPMPPPVEIVEPKQEGERRAELITESQPFLFIAYKRPSMYDKSDPVLDVIDAILSSGRTGWLYQSLVREKRVAIGAGASDSLPGGKYPNLFLLYAVPANGKTVAENEQAIYDVLARLKDTKVDEQTLNRVKTKVRAGLIRALDSNAGLASQLANNEGMYGDWRKMFTGIDDINKVTADDVQRVAREIFVEAGRTVAFTKIRPAQNTAAQPSGAAQ